MSYTPVNASTTTKYSLPACLPASTQINTSEFGARERSPTISSSTLLATVASVQQNMRRKSADSRGEEEKTSLMHAPPPDNETFVQVRIFCFVLLLVFWFLL